MKLVHLINPFPARGDKEHEVVQPITFASILTAKAAFSREGSVSLYFTKFGNEAIDMPEEFVSARFLTKSVKDFPGFATKKPLPFIEEIFQKLDDLEADYFIYTNIDIALKPEFYNFVFDEIMKGNDALIINRRRIPFQEYAPADLPRLYQLKGKTHPGFDCFVFKAGMQKQFAMDGICVGIPFVEATVAHNLFCFAQNPKLYPDEDLTFHLGMEIFKPRDKQLYWHNRHTFFKQIKPALWAQFDIRKFPYFEKGFPLRYWYWANNPALFTLMNLKLDLRNFINN